MSILKSCILLFALFLLSCSSGPKENQQNTEPAQYSTPEIASAEKEGENLYLRYCMACHQTNGSGVPGMYPPLINSPTVNSGKTEEFIKILLNGLKGPIEIHGKKYNQTMPGQSFLSDEELAKIINYVSKSFSNKGPEVSPADVKALRSTSDQ